MDNILNIRPPQKIYNVFKHLNYRYWYALAEFVDNSIESYLTNKKKLNSNKKYKLKIEIIIDADNKEIIIKDNAAGISEKEMERAFTPAVEPTGKGLSEFGMGMKAAGCWFCDFWTVRTKHFNEQFEKNIDFDLKEIIKKNITNLAYEKKTINNNKSYTIITLKKVSQFPHTNSIKKIKEYLTDIYRIFLREGEIEISLNDEKLEYEEDRDILFAPVYTKINEIVDELFSEKNILNYTYEELEDLSLETLPKYNKKINKKDYKSWKINLDFKFRGKRVKGYVGLLKIQSPSRSGLFLIRNKRIIVSGGYKPEEIFKGPNSQEYQRIFGELSLEGFKVTHTKDNINWEGMEEEFIKKLVSELKKDDFLKQANMYKKNLIENKRKELMEKYTDELEKQKKKTEEEKEKRKASEERAKEEQKRAEKEENKRKIAEEEVAKAKKDAKSANKRELFTKSLLTKDNEFVIKLQHQIDICTANIWDNLLDFDERLKLNEIIPNQEIRENYISYSLKEVQSISSITKIVTSANYNLESKEIEDDLILFISEYIENIPHKKLRKIDYSVTKNEDAVFITKFVPLEIIIVLDNLINNAWKANAKQINIEIIIKKDNLIVDFKDYGDGVKEEIVSKLFTWGETTTEGSGIGLYHVKEIIEKKEGTVSLIKKEKPTIFRLTIKKWN